MQWQRRRILIWGKTRPELSDKYREIVCTGGIFEEQKRLIRIYPIPLRYLDDEKVFKKYQWITAEVCKTDSDTRPESYKIRADGITVGESIPPKNGNWDARAKWILNDQNIVKSMEQLLSEQKLTQRSLGMVKPREISKIYAIPISDTDKARSWNRYKDIAAVQDLSFEAELQRKIRPLVPADYRFKIDFYCNDSTCKGHACSVPDWEVDALYVRLVRDGQSREVAKDNVIEELKKICSNKNDFYFFLGNMCSHPRSFSIVGFWRPKKRPTDLFD